MPLARAVRGGWWASAFTGLFPRKWYFDEESMTRFQPAQKACRRPKADKSRLLDRPYTTVWYGQNRRSNRRQSGEGANGRQEQRSGRDLAKHDRRDGEGIQFLRQSGDGVAGIQQGRQPGRRRYRGGAKATRRSHGEISRQHEPAEPGTDGRHGRAAAVDRGGVERDQGAAAPGSQ